MEKYLCGVGRKGKQKGKRKATVVGVFLGAFMWRGGVPPPTPSFWHAFACPWVD